MEKHSVSRLSYLFAHLYLLSSYSFSSDLLSSNLPLLSASALLCFSSLHIVGSLTSKLPWYLEMQFYCSCMATWPEFCGTTLDITQLLIYSFTTLQPQLLAQVEVLPDNCIFNGDNCIHLPLSESVCCKKNFIFNKQFLQLPLCIHVFFFQPHVGNSMIFFVGYKQRGDTTLILIISFRFTVRRKTMKNIEKYVSIRIGHIDKYSSSKLRKIRKITYIMNPSYSRPVSLDPLFSQPVSLCVTCFTPVN